MLSLGSTSGMSVRILSFEKVARALVVVWVFSGLTAQAETEIEKRSIAIQWSIPLPAKHPIQSEPSNHGLQIWDASSMQGKFTLLGIDGSVPALILDAGPNGPGRILHPPFRGEAYHLAHDSTGAVWIAGIADRFTDFSSATRSNAYLARIAQDGRLLAEYQFKSRSFRAVQSVRALSSGNLVLIARDGDATWLTQVTPNGTMRWERRFATGKGADVAVLADGLIVAAAFEASQNRIERQYRDDVVVRVFNPTGDEIAATKVREGVNERIGSFFGKLIAEANEASVYVASSWIDPSRPKPIEVASISADGAVKWRKLLSGTIAPWTNSATPRWRMCEPSLSVLPSGDALVACAIEDRIDLYRLDQATGAVSRTYVALPECHGGRPTRLFPFPRADGTLWLVGTRPANNVAASCTWLARVE